MTILERSLGETIDAPKRTLREKLRALALGAASPSGSHEDDIGVSDEAADEVAEQGLFKDVQARAAELTAATIAQPRGPRDAALVAGILRAMGYDTHLIRGYGARAGVLGRALRKARWPDHDQPRS